MIGMAASRALVGISADQICGDTSVSDLVTRAGKGERQAWGALVERYSPLVWSVCRGYRLDGADASEAGRRVFRHLAEELDSIGDPAALAGWLVTTARRECCRALHGAAGLLNARSELDVEYIPGQRDGIAGDELLMAERHAVLREAFAELPPRCQQLIGLLIADPPVSHAEISAGLGIPEGDILSTRARCLDRLRSHLAIVVLINATTGSAEGPCRDESRALSRSG